MGEGLGVRRSTDQRLPMYNPSGVLVNDTKRVEQFAVDLKGKVLTVGDAAGVDGLHVDLVLAVLHVHKRTVVSIEELGIALGSRLFDCLLELESGIGLAEHAVEALVVV